MYSGTLTGLQVSFSLVCWGSLVYGWDMSCRPRSVAVTVGVPLLVYCGWYGAGCCLMAYALPLRFLELPFVLPAIVAALYVPSCASSVLVWNRLLRRRLHPRPALDFEPVELELEPAMASGAGGTLVSDLDSPRPAQPCLNAKTAARDAPANAQPGAPLLAGAPGGRGGPGPRRASDLSVAGSDERERPAPRRKHLALAWGAGAERDALGPASDDTLDGSLAPPPSEEEAGPGKEEDGPRAQAAQAGAEAGPLTATSPSSRMAISLALSASEAGTPRARLLRGQALRAGRRRFLDDAPEMAWRLLKFMGGLTVQIYPMWGYVFLFSLFEDSGSAQVLISLAFSVLSFATCFAILRAYRGFLGDLLPDYGGPAMALLWLLVRVYPLPRRRAAAHERPSSSTSSAASACCDCVVCFAPLLTTRVSDDVGRRLYTVGPRTPPRPARPRPAPPRATRGQVPASVLVLTRPMRRLSSALASTASLLRWRRRPRSVADSHPHLPALAGPPLAAITREHGGVELVRESGRALFFLQALSSISASVQFVVILTVFRFGPARALFPYHEAVLPARGYAACLLAAAASVAIMAACLGAVWLLSARGPAGPGPGGAAAGPGAGAASARLCSAAVRDGFEIGWTMVDVFGKRIAGMWMTSVLITTAAVCRHYGVFSVVFPAAFVPSAL
eukprot:tig00020556_g11065.t1